MDFFARRMVYHCNRGELQQREGGPLPALSVLTDDCIQRGRDITDGGPVYNYHSICFIGTAMSASFSGATLTPLAINCRPIRYSGAALTASTAATRPSRRWKTANLR